ncbi:MAG: carboxypeptidase regulatory-like domain-containing protein [Methanomassiliicoccaceae archaeon]|jgi:5-hydroxyisourate hydrolase-like protein (transthyretin family)|nr:carboxypeptidase regulatory-like domain-containing protein [Methanomassiliicoccaceae archaeon]
MKGLPMAAVAAAVFVFAMFIPVFFSDSVAADDPVPPSIDQTTLQDGVVGVYYSQTLTADGDPVITWTRTGGNLPDGLSLSDDGAISGIPETSGTFEFTVTAANDEDTDEETFSIDIAPASVSISGNVYGISGAALDGIKIHVNGELTSFTVNRDGEFDLAFDAGSLIYTIKFERKGYVVESYFCDGVRTKGETLTMTASEDPSELYVIFNEAYGTIEGTVTLDGKPAKDIVIEVDEIFDTHTEPRGSMKTGADGKYSFTLPAGRKYHVSVNHNELMAKGKKDGVRIDVLAVDMDPIDFELVPKVLDNPIEIKISGKVSGISGAALDGIKIYVNGELTSFTVNKDREFDLAFDTDSLKYTIKFERKGYVVESYFCDGVRTEGDTLTMTASEDPSELYVVLYEAYGTIEGTVTLNGSPAKDIVIEIHEIFDTHTEPRNWMKTDADGKYSFTLPVGGKYHISVNSYDLMAKGKKDGVRIEVLVVDMDPIDFELVPRLLDEPVTIKISGRVVTEFGGAGLDEVRIHVNDKLIDDVVWKEGGFFEFVVDIDYLEYTVKFEKRGFAVRGYFHNDVYTEVENIPIKLDANDGDAEINVILLEAYGTIAGTVTHAGNPMGGITIEVYDIDTELRYTRVTGSDGKYSFSLPVGGNYHVSVNSRNFAADGKEGGVSVESLDISNPPIDFELLPKEGALFLFGYDLTHSLMLIGGIVGLFMLIFVVLYRIHIRRNPELSKIHSESFERKKNQE